MEYVLQISKARKWRIPIYKDGWGPWGYLKYFMSFFEWCPRLPAYITYPPRFISRSCILALIQRWFVKCILVSGLKSRVFHGQTSSTDLKMWCPKNNNGGSPCIPDVGSSMKIKERATNSTEIVSFFLYSGKWPLTRGMPSIEFLRGLSSTNSITSSTNIYHSHKMAKVVTTFITSRE